MKASKFTEAQIAFVLKQAEDGTPVAEVCRKAGISDATFYNWRKRYAGLMPSEMKRLRQLEEENAKLKRIVADRRAAGQTTRQDQGASGLRRRVAIGTDVADKTYDELCSTSDRKRRMAAQIRICCWVKYLCPPSRCGARKRLIR